MNTFNFVGKISLGRDSEKFHPVDRREFSSGWMNTTVKFNCISGTNRILCMTQGGKWKNDKKNLIKTFGKSITDENGNVTKGEKIEIKWDKRFDEDQIEKVAGFRKFVCDTGDTKMRYKLQDLVKAFENGTVTDEMMEQVGYDNLDDAKEALEKSNAKKRVFLSEYDFAEHMARVAASDKFKNKMFYISGNYDISYNAEKKQFYTNYHVNRVVMAPDDATPSTEMKIDFYYDENAWDDTTYKENGKVFLNGWVDYYDGNLKKTGFKNIVVTVKETDEKKIKGFKRKFTDIDGIKQIGLTLSVIEGAERVELTVDMLSDEDKEDLDCGLVEWNDLKKAYGGSVVGDKVSELRFSCLTAKKNVAQDTIYTEDDMHPAKEGTVENTAEDDVNIDIFDDEDDL